MLSQPLTHRTTRTDLRPQHPMTDNHPDPRIAALIARAGRLADIEAGIACAGTKLESRTLKVRGKAFAFLRPGNLMFKLHESLDEAMAMARATPERIQASANGWVTVRYATAASASEIALLGRWLDESHALFAAGAVAPRKSKAKPAGRRATASPGAKKKAAKAKR